MKTIKAFGDSFFYGSDLLDCPGDSLITPSQQTWPALVAKKLNLNYKCYAEPGRSNSWIAQQVLRFADASSLNVIQWTWIDRWEFYNTVKEEWLTVRPTGADNPLATPWYKYFQNELQDKWHNLNVIHSTHAYLKENNIPFVSHFLDDILLDRKYHCPTYIQGLLTLVDASIKRFPEAQTFLAWSRSNNFAISNNWHPLEEAHAAAAQLWLPEYQKLPQ